MTGPVEIRVEKSFRHPPERVFDAFLDPARVGLWLFRTPGGRMEHAELEPRVGGGFEIFERRGEELARHWGQFVEIDRPRRIVFDFWVDEAPTQKTRVTVAFAPSAEGCDVVLTHALEAAWAAWAERTVAGWTMILDNLHAVTESDR